MYNIDEVNIINGYSVSEVVRFFNYGFVTINYPLLVGMISTKTDKFWLFHLEIALTFKPTSFSWDGLIYFLILKEPIILIRSQYSTTIQLIFSNENSTDLINYFQFKTFENIINPNGTEVLFLFSKRYTKILFELIMLVYFVQNYKHN